MNCGSVDSFQVSTKCGSSPNARRIREIDDCDRPVALAMYRVDLVHQTLQAISREPAPPSSDGLLPSPQRHRHVLVGRSLRVRQHDPRPKSQCLGRFRASRPLLQRVAFGLGQYPIGLRPPRPRAIGQSVQPRLDEAPTLFTHRRRRRPQICSDLLARSPGPRARQHNLRPFRQPEISSRPPNKPVTLLADKVGSAFGRPVRATHEQ
jgi:hypothetical protein